MAPGILALLLPWWPALALGAMGLGAAAVLPIARARSRKRAASEVHRLPDLPETDHWRRDWTTARH